MRRATAYSSFYSQVFCYAYLSQSISTQFTLEIYAAATNCKKTLKTPILEV